MNKLNKKQKIVILILATIIFACFYYYTYTKDESFSMEQAIVTEENTNTENTTKEEVEKIKVHVTGAVLQEGLVELEKGSRIADAIALAGGTKEEACVSEINLAYILEDGMQIKIPTIQEVSENKKSEENITGLEKTVLSTTQNKKANTKVNINTANRSELETLPGIGETTATKIIEYREKNGKFAKIEDIKNVKGIGDGKFNKIKELIGI